MNITILSNRKYNIPDNVYKVNCIAQNRIVYKTQSKYHTFTHSYSNTNDMFIHGGGQGSVNSGTLWNFISTPLLEAIEKLNPRCDIQYLTSNTTWNIKIIEFVDDNRQYVNIILQHLQESLEEAMNRLVNILGELLTFVGSRVMFVILL